MVPNETPATAGTGCILYCHCAYANVVPKDVKDQVLQRLVESGTSFEAVADLCELSATNDPALVRLAGSDNLRIAACYPRAVKWLFIAGGAVLPDEAAVVNMRTLTADEVMAQLADTVRNEVSS